MPSVNMTAIQVAGIGSPQFLVDGTGAECVLMGTPTPTTIRIFNLTGGFYNISDNWRNNFCQVVVFESQFTIGPTDPIVRTVNGGGTAFGMNAHDRPPGTYQIRVEWGAVGPPPAPCAFGTRLKPAAAASAVVTLDLIAAILAPEDALWLAPVLNVLAGQVIDSGALCSGPPPPLPNISASTPTDSFATWLQILEALAWPFFCECIPGTPAPQPYPPPTPIQPTPWPVYPSYPCAPADLCATLDRILKQILVLQQSVSTVGLDVELAQRYGLPFAYIRGTRFSGLTGSGSRTIRRSVGILIEVTSFPIDNRQMIGAPPYIFDLGWISVLTGDGMLDEIRLTRQATTWLSKVIPSAVSVGWGLREGVTIEIQELLAEP